MKPLAKLTAPELHDLLARQQGRMYKTHETLERIYKGAGLDRDKELVEYISKIRNKIMVLKQRWLTQNLFTEQPRPLFYVEGTSKCILLDHIPHTDANVYVVSDYTMLVNYTRLCLKLLFSDGKPHRQTYICTETVFFAQDIVSTKDEALAEKHAEKIAYFQAKYK